MTVAPATRIGEVVSLEISGAWAIEPALRREGPADIIVEDGVIESVTWLDGGDDATGQDPVGR